jgi:hypothetical protein
MFPTKIYERFHIAIKKRRKVKKKSSHFSEMTS